AMNTFEQIGALVPMVRYDERFARAIGKWVLNAANASRLFYPNYLPDINQDSELWAHQYDSTSVIGHEAIHEYDPHNPPVSPYATGDAISGGWGNTTLTLYSSSHVGIMGAVIDTSDVEGILLLNALSTDYFHNPAYPTYLVFNPYSYDTLITMDLGSETFDMYDAVSNIFIQTNVTALTTVNIPADQARLIVLTPPAGAITYQLDQMLVDGVVVDFHSGQVISNYPPRIKSVSALPELVLLGQTSAVYCTATDREGDSLSYSWSANGGVITGIGTEVNWNAPSQQGIYQISCTVDDNQGGWDTASVNIQVVEQINQAPLIEKMSASPRKIDLGGTSALLCEATDPDGDTLSYEWFAQSGVLTDSGATAHWIAPLSAGNYYISCIVSDGNGGQAQDSIGIVVRDFSNVQTGKLVAYYPFSGNANDASGNNHHGTVSGAVLVQDRLGNPNSAYYFDGVNDYIRVPNHDSLNFRQSMTVNFWMNISQLYTREAFPISHGSWENRWKVSIIPDHKLRWTIKTDNPGNNGIIDLDT
ncbi:MAG: laminin G, partial [bacterium]